MKTITTILTLAALGLANLANAGSVIVDAKTGNPVLKAGEKQTTFIKVGLTGKKWTRPEADRAPVNVAIVLDKSGSMAGDKIRQAREAAKLAVKRLTSEDIVSVIAYDSSVKVLVPATKARDKAAIYREIDAIRSGGNTALFAGVAKGSEEIRKFIEKERVNRIILLSDGLANVGPSSPAALGGLGGSLAKENISVSTIGLGSGYNEDLMYELADRSDGQHHFAESPAELAGIFDRELGDVLSVVAQEIRIEIRCSDRVRPVRILGRKGEITGQSVFVPLTQVYSEDEQYVILEVEVQPGQAGRRNNLATVSVSYFDLENEQASSASETLAVGFVKTMDEVVKKANADVMAAGLSQIATGNNFLAMQLRDQGKIEEAKQVLSDNGAFCEVNGNLWGCAGLVEYGRQNDIDASNLDKIDWRYQKKVMRDQQFYNTRGGLQKGQPIKRGSAEPWQDTQSAQQAAPTR